MANVIRPPCFNRPPVANPHKRRRKGTIDLGKKRRGRAMLLSAYGTLKPADDARPYDFPLSPTQEWIPISVDGDIGALRLIRALQSEGLMMTDGKIVDWPTDELPFTRQLMQIINELTPAELIEALEAIKAIKARRGRAS